MPLASLDNINVHLPEDKLKVLDADDNALQLDAETVIKAKLSGTYSPTTLATWVNPADTVGSATPDIISEVAGKLIAAIHYARTFSSEGMGVPEYAQWLYDQAMGILDDIVLGLIGLPDVPETPDTGQHLTRDMFWPNNDTVGVRFKRSDVF